VNVKIVDPLTTTVKEINRTVRGLESGLWLQEFEVPKSCRQSAHESGNVVSPMHRPSLSPGDIPGWVNPRAIVQPEGFCQWKIPMTHDLTACSAVPQPTALPRTPIFRAWRGGRNTALLQVAHDCSFPTHCVRCPVFTTSFGWLLESTAECRL
jgi:hypothetical protein